MQHHEFSPSHLEQIRLCPGSHIMQKGLPEKETPWSLEGTKLHKAVETGDTSALNPDQKEVVEKCLEFLANLDKGEDPIIEFEKKVEVRDAAGNIVTYGFIDVLIRSKTKLIIIDWKFGFIPVKVVAENIQLATYALAALQLYPEYSECECHVFQPRIYNHSFHTFRNKENILANIFNLIEKAKSEDLLLRPSDSSCRYCKARLGCPAFRVKYQQLQASIEIYNLDDERVLSHLYAASLTVKGHISEIEDAVKARITEKGSCGNYIFQTQRGAREIKDINALYDVVKDYLTPREFNATCKVSVAKIESAIADKLCAAASANGEKMTKTAGKSLAESKIVHLVTRAADRFLVVEKE